MSTDAKVQIALWLAVTGFALWRGPLPVRAVSLALLSSLAASLILWGRVDPYGVKLHLLIGDLVVLAACGWAVGKTRSLWATSAAAFQTLSLMTQTVKLVDPSILGWGYLTLGIVWGYGVLASLLAGALVQRRP